MYCHICLKWTDYNERGLCNSCIDVVDSKLPKLLADFRKFWKKDLLENGPCITSANQERS